ncbi:DUF116 domain-containing protein [Acetivibrio thermocellus]|uniref:DUF116 domain-containing protein n=1 Tax=Acetivibrio thermocellus TaxID=1515 RepID=UPI001F3935C9|nr:DUF116 domain-containing protein [Acetivibrio thermocellus]UWV45688.1 DUF116 domain-containing protein [Acetivibrio thermocellus]
MKYLDNSYRNFASLMGTVLVLFVTILAAFGLLYSYSTINTYNFILLVLILITVIVTLFYFVSSIAIMYVYRRKKASRIVLCISRTGLRMLFPLVIVLTGLFGGNKDTIKKFYIDFNNLLVDTMDKKYSPDEIMILLPHCLQYSECEYKITNDINNCKRCGRCCIGFIADISAEKKVPAYVVTGGTAARNIVSKKEPKIIISVACERDLSSGIADVGRIPVIGIVNDRPNGPCYNTNVDVDAIRNKLESIINEKE